MISMLTTNIEATDKDLPDIIRKIREGDYSELM